eukprot:Clim_evm83s88 gene=Clim_evmTU83s88
MPKSRRNKIVNLTKTEKRTRNTKGDFISELRELAEKYSYVYVFQFENVRNQHVNNMRMDWRHSRFILGKNKVMTVALGKTPEDELRKDLHKLSGHLKGDRGLLFTDKDPEAVTELFAEHRDKDFARAGFVATQTIELPEGPLPDFQHTQEPFLRKLGMPTVLNKGVIELRRDFTVATEGKAITQNEATLIKQLGIKLAEFKASVVAVWHDGRVREYED